MVEQRESLVHDELLSPREVAAILGVNASTLRNWDESLRPVRLPSGHRRYWRSVVEGLLQIGESA